MQMLARDQVREASTADEYSNASDPERLSTAPSDARPAPTTFTDRLGTSSHRGGQDSNSLSRMIWMSSPLARVSQL
jgi:hypothetical protein